MRASSKLPLFLLAPLGAAAFTLPKAPFVNSPTTSLPDVQSNEKVLHMSSVMGGDEGRQSPFKSFFEKFQKDSSAPLVSSKEVVIEPDYKLAWVFALSAVWILLFFPDKSCYDATVVQFCPPTYLAGASAFLHGWFALFLADRAKRIRVVFDKKHFLMKDVYDDKQPIMTKLSKMKSRDKNYVIGGPNRWAYDKFVNYDFFPSVHLPVLCYFKENQTPPTKWKAGPGKYDPYGGGMVHFFPAFGNSYQIKKEFEAHGCKKK